MRLTLFAVAALLSVSFAARADSVFAVSGTFASGAVLSGTVTALASGDPLTIDATVTQGLVIETFDTWAGAGETVDSFIEGLTTPGSAATEELYLYFPQRYLFNGEVLCSTSAPCAGGLDFSKILSRSNIATIDSLASGQITAVAATPEPSSFALLGTGVLGVAGVVRRRFA